MNEERRADVLTRATRYLREEQDAALAGASPSDIAPLVGDPTWSRIVTDVRRGRRRNRIVLAALALPVAIGIGGVGYAAVTGRLTTLVRRLSAPAAQPERTAPSAPAHRATRAQPPVAPAEDVPGIPAPPRVEPEPAAGVAPSTPPRASSERRPVRRAAAAAPAVPAAVAPAPAVSGGATPAAAPAGAAIDALYREAHRLHFASRDFGAALAAWDRFLAAGTGPLVIEARYNRAIALAHLGRRGEAIVALRPFADGEAGAYRQREARALIERFSSEE